jgi:hypothetical protein
MQLEEAKVQSELAGLADHLSEHREAMLLRMAAGNSKSFGADHQRRPAAIGAV